MVKEYDKGFLYTEAKVRYEKKSDSLHLLLFYTSCLWKPGLTVSPVEIPDIVLYLLQLLGKYTGEKLKAYKSLEAGMQLS